MSFPANVERWRKQVENAITLVHTKKPNKKTSQDALGLTNANLVDIILSLIATESAGNELATGDDGNSVGLMQLNYGAGTPQGEGYTGSKQNLYDANTNLFYGVSYFLTQLARYKNVNEAILAYNAGSVRLNQEGVPINIIYLRKVLSFLEKKNSVLHSQLLLQLDSLFFTGFTKPRKTKKRVSV